jgi:hypothetical protein
MSGLGKKTVSFQQRPSSGGATHSFGGAISHGTPKAFKKKKILFFFFHKFYTTLKKEKKNEKKK